MIGLSLLPWLHTPTKPAMDTAETPPKVSLDFQQPWEIWKQPEVTLALTKNRPAQRLGLAGPWFLGPPKVVAKPQTMRPAKPNTVTAQDWFQVLPAIGDAVLRADFDAYNLPFSRNVVGNPEASSRMMRSSEYKPKHGKYAGTYVEIPEGVFGRAHAEIRPIKGSDESLITRVTLDYQGGEVKFHLPKFKKLPLGHLELDCFTAVTPPTMTFDFSQGANSVRSIGKDGDLKYENGCIKRKRSKDVATTPWESEAPPPPKTKTGKNPDWMFYFQPIESTLGQTIVRRYINRNHRNGKFMGGLFLWANNPTFGFTDKSHFEKLGIRENSWPRKLGDLFRFFSPLFDGQKREALKQNAPFLNPNTEYLDAEGKRQKIPDDPLEIQRLNKERKKLGLEEIPRSRGPAVDWVFTDLFNDPVRMAATPANRWPAMNLRLQFKPNTELQLPVGKIRIQPNTDVKIAYRSSPVKTKIDGKERVRARTVLSLDFGPLALGKTDLRIGDFTFHVGKNLKVEHLHISIPFEQEYSPDGKSWKLSPNRNAIKVQMTGLHGEDIHLKDGNRGATYSMESFDLKSLTLKHQKSWAQAKLEGLSGKKLSVIHDMGQLSLEQAEIPQITLQARHDLTDLWVKVPKILATGNTHLEPNYGNKTEIDLEGVTEISEIFFRRHVEKSETKTTLKFKVKGTLPSAQIVSPLWGQANLSMREGERLHHLSGEFKAEAIQDTTNPKAKGKLDYEMNLVIPYTGFDLSTPVVKMPPGGSTLRNGIVRIGKDKLSFEGDLDWHADEIKAPGTDVFRWKDFTVKPNLKDLHVHGSALLVYTPEGFLLRKRPGGLSPLGAEFRLTDSSFSHIPQFSEAELKSNPELQVIRTGVDIKDARVSMEEIQEVQYESVQAYGKTQGRILRLETGPITLHHIRGGGDIWVNTALWSWLKGSFPHFGEPLTQLPKSDQTPKPKKRSRPDIPGLIGHLDTKTQKLLWDDTIGDYSNFVRIGSLSVGSDPAHPEDTDRSLTQFKDLLIYAHETGNRWQFAAVGIPELGFLQRLTKSHKPVFNVFTGPDPIYTHIYLKDPIRGFDPFLLKSPRSYQPPADK